MKDHTLQMQRSNTWLNVLHVHEEVISQNLKIILDLYTYEYNFSILNTDETICVFFWQRVIHDSLG